MAYVTNSVVPARSISSGLIPAFFAVLRETLQRRKIYKNTINELSQLSDRELADLAISRGDFHSLAIDAAYGKARR